MLITAIQIKRVENATTKMKGLASVVLDDMVVIKDIKVLLSDNEYFLAMPSKQIKNGTFKDMVHPINASVREAFEKLIIGGYIKTEASGYTRSILTCQKTGKASLLDQTCDDFLLEGVQETYTIPDHSKQDNVTEKLDDSLLKWLES